MIELVGEDDTAREELAERRQRGLVRDVARGEKQRRFLAVKRCELFFQLNVEVGVAANVARAAGTGANFMKGTFCLLYTSDAADEL